MARISKSSPPANPPSRRSLPFKSAPRFSAGLSLPNRPEKDCRRGAKPENEASPAVRLKRTNPFPWRAIVQNPGDVEAALETDPTRMPNKEEIALLRYKVSVEYIERPVVTHEVIEFAGDER